MEKFIRLRVIMKSEENVEFSQLAFLFFSMLSIYVFPVRVKKENYKNLRLSDCLLQYSVRGKKRITNGSQ